MKKALGAILITISTLLGLIVLIGTLLFSFSILEFGSNLLTILFFVVIGTLLLLSILICIALYRVSNKEKEIVASFAKRMSKEEQLIGLYNKLGIKPVRNEKGEIMNIYDLLGIEPEYDENGVRVPTVYEILQILPKFDEHGKEIPAVVFIKNKATKLAKKEKLGDLLKTTFITKETAERIKADQAAAAAAAAALAATTAATKAKAKSESGPSKSKSSGGGGGKRTQAVVSMTTPTTKAKRDASFDKMVFDGFGFLKRIDKAAEKSDEKKDEKKNDALDQTSVEVVDEKKSEQPSAFGGVQEKKSQDATALRVPTPYYVPKRKSNELHKKDVNDSQSSVNLAIDAEETTMFTRTTGEESERG